MTICFDKAKEICAIPFDDPEREQKIACMLKEMVHAGKFDAYNTMFFYVSRASRKPRAFKKEVKYMFDDFVKLKVQTHDEFRKRGWRKQIYGLFDWTK